MKVLKILRVFPVCPGLPATGWSERPADRRRAIDQVCCWLSFQGGEDGGGEHKSQGVMQRLPLLPGVLSQDCKKGTL